MVRPSENTACTACTFTEKYLSSQALMPSPQFGHHAGPVDSEALRPMVEEFAPSGGTASGTAVTRAGAEVGWPIQCPAPRSASNAYLSVNQFESAHSTVEQRRRCITSLTACER